MSYIQKILVVFIISSNLNSDFVFYLILIYSNKPIKRENFQLVRIKACIWAIRLAISPGDQKPISNLLHTQDIIINWVGVGIFSLRGGRGSVAAMSRRGVENRNTNIFQVTERKRKVNALDKDKCEDYSWKSKLKEGFLEVVLNVKTIYIYLFFFYKFFKRNILISISVFSYALFSLSQ